MFDLSGCVVWFRFRFDQITETSRIAPDMIRKPLMKFLMVALVLAFASTGFGQSAKEYVQSGFDQYKKHDYLGAIADFSKAIAADRSSRDGYLGRGLCEVSLNDIESAMTDFAKTIELDPKFAKGYLARATVYGLKEKSDEALADLNEAIDLDSTIPAAFLLRGPQRLLKGNKKGACDDFAKAKALGDTMADELIRKFCGNDQLPGESLQINWPESENWKIGVEVDNETTHDVDMIHSNETLEAWTEIVTMTIVKNTSRVPMDEAMKLTLEESKKRFGDVALTFIEKDENTEYPWIIFTVESPSPKSYEATEARVWYIVQGKQALFTNFVAIKQATVSPEMKAKWVKVFKATKVVTK